LNTARQWNDHIFSGSQFELAQDMKVVVSVTIPGKAPEQAHFTPQQKAAAVHQH